jgi:hypothetical protein
LQERFRETERFVQSAAKRLCEEGASNTEWLELGLRAAMMADATEILEMLLNSASLRVRGDAKRPGEKCAGRHRKEVQTLFGTIALERNYYYDAASHAGRFPLDEALGLHNSYSAGVARLMCRAGGRDSYEQGSADLLAYAAIEVSGRQINRLVDEVGPGLRGDLEAESAVEDTKTVPRMYISCDGTGVPMRKNELAQVKGKAADGTAKTREVKTGCVFTQHPVDGEDPFRDSDSTSYIATMRRCDEFGLLLRKEAYRRGMGRAGEVVFIADGAPWIWEIVRTCFPGAVEILDYFHAREYLGEILDLLFGKQSPRAIAQLKRWKQMLFEDQVHKVIKEARRLAATHIHQQAINAKINYLHNNQQRMQYGTCLSKGYFYGSGVIEAGCKSVIGKRAKQSGMFCSQQGVENVLAIRTALCSNRFDSYWDRKNAA